MIKQTGILKKKASEAVIALGIKRVIVQAIFTISNIFLARLLFPADFGMFAIVTFVGAIFAVFSDIGLGPALIQKKDKIATRELQTVFTFQFSLSILIFLIINSIAPVIAEFYSLGSRGALLFHIYSIYFLFGPFKTTSGAILERNLEYRKVVTIELSEIFCASLVTVILAVLGLSVFSFVIGGVCGHVIGASLYFKFSPWPIRIMISVKKLTALARFGIHVQTNVLLGLIYGPLVLLYLGKQVGAENLGFYQFAASLSVLPLAISEIVNRIVFPLGARVQKEKLHFQKIIERSIIIVSATALPLAFMGIVAAPTVVHYVYTDRWIRSLPAIYLGLAQMVFIAYSGIFGQLLLSRGQSKIMRNMSAVWALLTWILAPPLIASFNFVGMSLTGLLVSGSGVWLWWRLRQEVKFAVWSGIWPFFASALVAGVVVLGLRDLLAVNIFNFVGALLAGVVIYAVGVWFLAKNMVIDGLRSVLAIFVGSKSSKNRL